MIRTAKMDGPVLGTVFPENFRENIREKIDKPLAGRKFNN